MAKLCTEQNPQASAVAAQKSATIGSPDSHRQPEAAGVECCPGNGASLAADGDRQEARRGDLLEWRIDAEANPHTSYVKTLDDRAGAAPDAEVRQVWWLVHTAARNGTLFAARPAV